MKKAKGLVKKPAVARKAKSPDKRASITWPFLDSVHVPILVFSGAKRGNPVLFANDSAEELFGCEKQELIGLSLSALFAPPERQRSQAIMAVLREPGGRRLLEEPEMMARRRSGRKFPVKVTASSLDMDGERLIVVSFSDLTEQKRQETERENTAREVLRMSKLADIGQFIAGIAHELNNPLTIITGFAENIELFLESDIIKPEEIRSQLEPIFKATDRMTRLIGRLMRMVRQDDLRLNNIDIRDVVTDTLHFMHHRLDDFKISVHVDQPDPALVHCDPNQIEQILLNLLSNAIHALRKNRDTREIRVQTVTDQTGVRIKVHNNGPPIPAEIRDRIMSPFFTTKAVGEGTGLGLALSNGIMKAHGGDLTFNSSRSEGTEFILSFPPVTVSEVARPDAVHTVIIADDDESSRRMLAGKLKRYGFQVVEAENGERLLEEAKNHPQVECLFIDIYMPRTTPSLIIHGLRRVLPTALIYVVTNTTGSDLTESEIRKQEINGFLSKPIDHEAFAEIMRQLDGRIQSAA